MAPQGPVAFYFYHNSYNKEFFFLEKKIILAQVALAFSLFKEIDFYYFQAQMCLCVHLQSAGVLWGQRSDAGSPRNWGITGTCDSSWDISVEN